MAAEKSVQKSVQVSVTLGNPDEKKKVIRYRADSDDLSSVYVGKAALKKLGNPKKIKVTIEAA